MVDSKIYLCSMNPQFMFKGACKARAHIEVQMSILTKDIGKKHSRSNLLIGKKTNSNIVVFSQRLLRNKPDTFFFCLSSSPDTNLNIHPSSLANLCLQIFGVNIEQHMQKIHCFRICPSAIAQSRLRLDNGWALGGERNSRTNQP